MFFSQLESRYFTIMKDFKCFEHRQLQGSGRQKVVHSVGQKRLIHCQHFSFSFSLLNYQNPCLKLPQSEQARQCSILQVSRGTGIVSAKLACFCQTDPLLVVNPSSMPLVFRLVLLFFKDFSGLQHWVSWTVYIEVDAQT